MNIYVYVKSFHRLALSWEDCQNNPTYFQIVVSTGKEGWSFIISISNVKVLWTRMLCAKFGKNWHRSSGEEVENAKRLWQWQPKRQHTNIDQNRALEPLALVNLKLYLGFAKIQTSCFLFFALFKFFCHILYNNNKKIIYYMYLYLSTK